MKILTVADRVEPALYEHFQRDRFPGVRLILSCGDLPPEYLSFLTTMFNVPLFYVRGNHDIRHGGYFPEGCIDIDARLELYMGLRILGLEGSRWYNGKPHQYTESQMRRKIRRARLAIWRRKGVDIVVTHAPPRHIHDAEDQCHRGFKCFHGLIERYAPRYFIHGHIHVNFTSDEQRITVASNTKVINSYGYTLVEIDNDPSAEKVKTPQENTGR